MLKRSDLAQEEQRRVNAALVSPLEELATVTISVSRADTG